ncbi:helix-turn-helix transcriptional regulator [Blastococcus saxobsidens]|uniref:Putative Transcriptional regulator, LuxR family n=1 Tax=Blastococcus saxobsidens (strain DD2) TaxID=1146883 RepID=H6RWT7_BLASD|nr:helix-turn-helix transcriptional regulator [Blastococcus saxobsidens]CCG02149.1 putative Transcriptional regulator, LuxR family [Blastococcus saxobsidens DD2]
MAPTAAVRDRIERLCRSATDPLTLYRDVVPVLGRAVPSDLWCGLLLDPATVLNTGGYHDEGLPLEVLPRLLELEVGADDVNQLPALARDRSGVGTIHRRTRGRPELSARYRDVMLPAGMGPELRAVLRNRGRPWGAVVFFRETGAPDFTDAELEFVAAVAPDIAAAVRRTLLVSEITHRDVEEGPGMAVLRVDGLRIDVELASRAARALMEAMPDSRIDGVPVGVVMLVSRLVAAGGRRQSARVRLRTGRWMSVQLDVLQPAGQEGCERLSLVIEPVAPYELAEVIAEAYGLTAREREVARLVVAGNRNPEVAAALSISLTTVQDHLKKVFAKLGVGSRYELTARMFFDQYLPRQLSRQPVGGDGWYLPARLPR